MSTTTDVFISFPGPKEDTANEIARLLESRGHTVFTSTKLPPHAKWNEEIPRRLEGARLCVVLVSRETVQAHYQKSEVELAINRERTPGSRFMIVPVDLDEDRSKRPFGLEVFKGIDARNLDFERIAERISEALDVKAPMPDVVEPPIQTYGDLFHAASLGVDRVNQWMPIVDLCRGRDSAIFLVPGERRQGLDLFLWRVRQHLADEATPHRFITIPLKDEHSHAPPRSPDGWEHNVRVALARGAGRGGTAEDLLRDAARGGPLFLFLRNQPLALADFDAQEMEALERFLGGPFPALLESAARVSPVRVLIAIYADGCRSSAGDQRDGTMEERLDPVLDRRCRGGKIRYRRLMPLEPVTWDHLRDFLDARQPRPPERVYERVQRKFAEIQTRDHTYEELVRMLGSELE